MVLRLRWLSAICLSFLLVSTAAKAQSNKPVTIQFEKQQIELSYKKHKKILTVEMAVSPEQSERGLMFREKLDADAGMLFVFDVERPLAFWMKNTLIDLDIGYFDKNKKLIDIQTMKATSILQKDFPSYPSKKPAQFALEMNSGWFKKNGFREGTVLKILPPSSSSK